MSHHLSSSYMCRRCRPAAAGNCSHCRRECGGWQPHNLQCRGAWRTRRQPYLEHCGVPPATAGAGHGTSAVRAVVLSFRCLRYRRLQPEFEHRAPPSEGATIAAVTTLSAVSSQWRLSLRTAPAVTVLANTYPRASQNLPGVWRTQALIPAFHADNVAIVGRVVRESVIDGRLFLVGSAPQWQGRATFAAHS